MTTPKQNKYGRRFDEEFKREVAALANQPGATIEQVAVDLGVSSHSVARWRRRLRAENAGKPPATASSPAAAPRATPPAGAAELERENRALRRELAEVRQQREILKKSTRHLLGGPALKMTIIKELAGQYPVRALCRALGVSRSAHYATAAKAARPRAAENGRLWVKIAACF